jgi:hypothetical protein
LILWRRADWDSPFGRPSGGDQLRTLARTPRPPRDSFASCESRCDRERRESVIERARIDRELAILRKKATTLGLAKRITPAQLLRLAIAGRLEPSAHVSCPRYGVDTGQGAGMPVRCCIQRQAARWPGKQAPIHDYCGSGTCQLGLEYRVRASYSAEDDWASKSKAHRPSYQFFRKDAGVQRKKRRLLILDDYPVPSIDVPPGYVSRQPIESDDDDVRVALAP